jgi:hypothetical protein
MIFIANSSLVSFFITIGNEFLNLPSTTVEKPPMPIHRLISKSLKHNLDFLGRVAGDFDLKPPFRSVFTG